MPPEPSLTLPAEVAEETTWLADRVALVETTAGFPSAHGLLVSDGEQTTLFDVGLSDDQLLALAPVLDQVVLTHCHLDHVLRWPLLEEVADPPELIVNGQEWAAFQGDDLAAFLGVHGEAVELLETELVPIYPTFQQEPESFQPGQPLELAGTRWETVPAPGHSPGHCLFHEPELGIVFSVDVEFSGLGPWYAWPHCDPTRFEQAVEKARPLFEEARVVATSHSPPIIDDPEHAVTALDAFQAHYDQRDQALHRALEARGKQGATVDELVQEVALFYGDHLESYPSLAYWSGVMTEKHLERLAGDGVIEAHGSRWFVSD